MQEKIKLISLNIEMKKHLDLVQAFLKKEQPDVICIQEVYEEDLRDLGENLQMNVVFGQMVLMGRQNQMEPPLVPFGIGILSRLPMHTIGRAYYKGSEEGAKQYTFKGDPGDYYRLLLYVNFVKGKSDVIIGTTHFTWAPDGEANDTQRTDLKELLIVLKQIPEIVCCGDFNAPRGTEIFDTIAQFYKDNIPSHYVTSIDSDLHRLGEKLREKHLMIDGLFTTPGYQCSNVRLQEGVSDHMAIVAQVFLKNRFE